MCFIILFYATKMCFIILIYALKNVFYNSFLFLYASENASQNFFFTHLKMCFIIFVFMHLKMCFIILF